MEQEYEIEKMLKKEDNVILVKVLDDEMKKNILLYEMKRLDEIVPFINQGMKKAMGEKEALLLIKENKDDFNTDQNKPKASENSFTLRTENGEIIGEMIYDEDELEELRNDPSVYFLSDNFVTYNNVGSNGQKQFFVMDEEPSSFITDQDIDSTVKSLAVAIPSTETDHYIKDCFDLPHDEAIGTVVIGFTPFDE